MIDGIHTFDKENLNEEDTTEHSSNCKVCVSRARCAIYTLWDMKKHFIHELFSYKLVRKYKEIPTKLTAYFNKHPTERTLVEFQIRILS